MLVSHPGWRRNFTVIGRDNLMVKCADCREALSARMDGEEEAGPAAIVDEHLDGCPACQRWHTTAGSITRTIRVRPAAATPDLTERILAAAAPPDRVRRHRYALRWALGAVAFVQLCLALAQLLGVDHTEHLVTGAGEHLFNESTAWNLGVAIGLLAAAIRPAFARGLLPALAVFVAVLVAVSIVDVVSGSVGADRLSSHSMVVIGLALLFLVDRQYRQNPLPGSSSAVPVNSPGPRQAEADDAHTADPGGTTRPPRWLRPAGRHAA
jgi:predicted anti-sigma-YlaC factor YlaD